MFLRKLIKMAKLFRVLVVDDKKAVLDAMKDWIEYNYQLADEDFKIELLLLHVEVIESNDKYLISPKTYEKLNEYCHSPFHLLLADFGFVKQGINTIDELERLKEINSQNTIRELIDRIVLNPSHIVNEAVHYHKLYKKIKKQFIDFKGNLHIYTYIPSKIEREYTSADVRRNVTNKHFPKANILLIDARKELFNNSKFDMKYDNEFYPFLIAKYLSKIIHIEIAEFLLKQTKDLRKKALRIQKNNRIITLSAILPSILAGVFIPSLFSSLEKGNYLIGFSFLITLILIVVVLTVLPKLLERNSKF